MSAPKVDVLAVLERMSLNSNALLVINDAQDAEMTLQEHQAIAAVAELIEAAAAVHAACRAGKEPDLIALADALDGVGARDQRKAAFALNGGAA